MDSKLEITNARRILLAGVPKSGKLTFLQALTGSVPAINGPTHAGLSHELTLKTAYYTVTIPIWIDEITPEKEDEWALGYLTRDAKEVLKVLGGFIVAFRKPQDAAALEGVKRALKAGHEVVKACGYAWDGVCLAVGMSQSLQPRLEMAADEWEEVCREFGFEYVDFEFKGRNEYGEPAGMERVQEALEANDWNGDDGGAGYDFDDEDEDGEYDGLKLIGDEMEREMFGLHNAIFGEDGHDGHGTEDEPDEECQVEMMETVMMRMQALKDLGDDVSKEERRRLAAKAITDIMKSS
ncbi:hypothetical protein RUND412_006331 [Rhizina undulata]